MIDRGMTDAENYKIIRNHLGFTAAELAEKLGVTRQTIHCRESGESKICMEAWMALELLDLGGGTHSALMIISRNKVKFKPRLATGGAFGKSRK